MKKIWRNANVKAIILLLIATAEIVIAAICTAMSGQLVAGYIFITLISVTMIRFAHPIAKWNNMVHSLWYRKNSDDNDDEPSELAVIMLKVAGYFFLTMQTIILVLMCATV